MAVMMALSGYVLASPIGKPIPREVLDFPGTSRSVTEFHFTKPLTSVKNWDEFRLITDTALMDETAFGAPPPFEYRVVCARSAGRLLLIAERRRIADQV